MGCRGEAEQIGGAVVFTIQRWSPFQPSQHRAKGVGREGVTWMYKDSRALAFGWMGCFPGLLLTDKVTG